MRLWIFERWEEEIGKIPSHPIVAPKSAEASGETAVVYFASERPVSGASKKTVRGDMDWTDANGVLPVPMTVRADSENTPFEYDER